MSGFAQLRRAVIKLGLSAPWLILSANSKSQDLTDRGRARQALHSIRSWGVQYQQVDVARIAASHLDLVVLDPSLNDWHRRFISAEEMAALKRKPDGTRRLVIGYLCIGETDVKRWYWPARWNAEPPSWLGPDNVNWPGSKVVRYWDRRWQELIVTGPESILSRIVDMGFDGALLDRVDAYGDWENQYASARRDMIALVKLVADRARQRHPGFLLIPQNAEHIIENQLYRSVIDGLNKESLLTGLGGENVPNRQIDIDWSLTRLRRAQADGVKMLATEYLSDPVLRATTEAQLTSWGILPFYGVRALDRLPW
ncbi:endo alpha-1,4 polygalactosaminidase [Phreatobacter sp.]|uniref:endo alpha-1,4 polygalactosaminidase n=1 Tax=Phreatobacter sp. TaxID=1966341 RepID=UPI003F6E7CE6